ncbi:MAG TPA: DUF5989 family protein [Candidatus Binatia bacterium]|nr:DUF5989 family protein [Candidatus Binatia bacterium]
MSEPTNGEGGREFDRMASAKSGNLFGEVWAFLGHNKKWWLLPLIVVLVLVGALIVLSTTAVAPFIYTLF